LVFTIYKSTKPNGIYIKILEEFEKLLAPTGLDERKEQGIQKRRKITLHSLRRFVKTVISDQTNQDYSEWFLGHNKSPYYTKKEVERRTLSIDFDNRVKQIEIIGSSPISEPQASPLPLSNLSTITTDLKSR
jgi:hypothetical protein